MTPELGRTGSLIGHHRRGRAHRVAVRGWTESPYTLDDEESEKAGGGDHEETEDNDDGYCLAESRSSRRIGGLHWRSTGQG